MNLLTATRKPLHTSVGRGARHVVRWRHRRRRVCRPVAAAVARSTNTTTQDGGRECVRVMDWNGRAKNTQSRAQRGRRAETGRRRGLGPGRRCDRPSEWLIALLQYCPPASVATAVTFSSFDITRTRSNYITSSASTAHVTHDVIAYPGG